MWTDVVVYRSKIRSLNRPSPPLHLLSPLRSRSQRKNALRIPRGIRCGERGRRVALLDDRVRYRYVERAGEVAGYDWGVCWDWQHGWPVYRSGVCAKEYVERVLLDAESYCGALRGFVLVCAADAGGSAQGGCQDGHEED